MIILPSDNIDTRKPQWWRPSSEYFRAVSAVVEAQVVSDRILGAMSSDEDDAPSDNGAARVRAAARED